MVASALLRAAHELAEFLVLLGVGLGIADHALDLSLRQPAWRPWMTMRCSLPVFHVLGRDIQNAVGVDVESHLDLRHAARSRRNVREVESAERFVVARTVALTLQYVDGHARSDCHPRSRNVCDALVGMVVFFSITLVMMPPQGLDPQRQGGHVEQTARP